MTVVPARQRSVGSISVREEAERAGRLQRGRIIALWKLSDREEQSDRKWRREEEESQMEAALPVSWRPTGPMTLTQLLPRLTHCEAAHVDVVHLYCSKKTASVS